VAGEEPVAATLTRQPVKTARVNVAFMNRGLNVQRVDYQVFVNGNRDPTAAAEAIRGNALIDPAW